MSHLDTHVVVWLASADRRYLSPLAYDAIRKAPCTISPLVVLELQLLHDKGRIRSSPDTIIDVVRSRIDVTLSATPLDLIVAAARPLTWTRDPFDRLIVAASLADGAKLITADRVIRDNLASAVW